MGVMQMQRRKVTLECDALCEGLVACQAKCFGIKQDVATQQKALQEALQNAIQSKKDCLNSMEDIEHYHQMLIDMKEQYQRDVEAFVKATKHNSNHMHLAHILVAS
jgi:hypothetical protein